MKTVFITYATNEFKSNALALVESAFNVGFDKCRLFTPNDIRETAFFEANRTILSNMRGGGYWLWKPYILLQSLKMASEKDVIFYSDAGRTSYYYFSIYPSQLIAATRRSPKGYLLGPAAPQLGPLEWWTKRDCLVLMDADVEFILAKPLLMTWSLWTKSREAIQFLEEWLDYCRDPRCLTDIDNQCGLEDHQGFRSHRHDQSIFSILAHKKNAPHLDFSDTLVHRVLKLRANSGISHNFYKRPENAERLLRSCSPAVLLTEYLRWRDVRNG